MTTPINQEGRSQGNEIVLIEKGDVQFPTTRTVTNSLGDGNTKHKGTVIGERAREYITDLNRGNPGVRAAK